MIEKISKQLVTENTGIKEENIHISEPMSKNTSFRTGGNADCMVIVSNVEELENILKFLTENEIKHLLIGNGSNLLFRDEGYRGVIVKMNGDFSECSVSGNRITAGSAVLLSKLSNLACTRSLSGMEFASGIPGSVGGAVFMNAGAYGGEIKDIVELVTVMSSDGKKIKTLTVDELEFAYRSSAIQRNGYVITKAVLKLTKGNDKEIRSKMEELNQKRSSKQPVNYPSAGSFFKRPEGGYAAALIEEASLKGLTVGGAQVSQKHSGFIINIGNATTKDIIELMNLVQNRVYDTSGIKLEPEVRII